MESDYEKENSKRPKKTPKKPDNTKRSILSEIDLIENALTIPDDIPQKGKKGQEKVVDTTIVNRQQITISDCIQSSLPVSNIRHS